MSKSTEILEEIYRGEKSATETYRQALQKVGDEPEAGDLMEMQRDHIDAMQKIGSHLNVKGEQHPEGSGAWGVWAKTVMGAAKIFGDKSALKALKEGEEHGLKQYRDALDSEIDPDVRSLIQSTFIPRQQAHISSLDRLMQRI